MPSDVVYHEGDESVEPKGCLMHTNIKQERMYLMSKNNYFVGIRYGLCKGCIEKLDSDPCYGLDIKDEIQKRITKLRSK